MIDWNTYRVSELKAELFSRGLRLSGKKAELVQRLHQSDIDRTPTTFGRFADLPPEVQLNIWTQALPEQRRIYDVVSGVFEADPERRVSRIMRTCKTAYVATIKRYCPERLGQAQEAESGMPSHISNILPFNEDLHGTSLTSVQTFALHDDVFLIHEPVNWNGWLVDYIIEFILLENVRTLAFDLREFNRALRADDTEIPDLVRHLATACGRLEEIILLETETFYSTRMCTCDSAHRKPFDHSSWIGKYHSTRGSEDFLLAKKTWEDACMLDPAAEHLGEVKLYWTQG